MAVDIKFDLTGNPEPPTLILANRNGNKLGQLNVNAESIELIDKFNESSEISFTVNKYIDGKIVNLWDKLVDFKLVYCKEWDTWFEATVELDEATESVKTVFCAQLGQAELSQIMLYNIEINTEEDIARDDYKITILYDVEDRSASLLDRILEKAPHYSIIHVDNTLINIQRSFSFDNTSIYDAFQEISEEIGCLFVFHSDSDENGMPQRTISVYDLQQNCNNKECGYRGEFTDRCPKCENTDIKYGYGEDTLIFVTSDELAHNGIQLVTDTDSVKNCFKLEAGDDLMTATVRNRNPNGTDYIWYFSDATKSDMPSDLVEKIEFYDESYKYYYNEHKSNLDKTLLSQYNALVDKYSVYNEELKKIQNPIAGFASLMEAYYNTIDLGWYLKSGLMPDVKMGNTDAEEQGLLLEVTLPPIIAVTNIDVASKATADSAILTMARAIVNSSYKVTIQSSQLTNAEWSGNFIITNYSDEEDTHTTGFVNRTLVDWDETYIKQKIEKILSKENTDNLSVTGLFANEYDEFCEELKKYALVPLTSFRDACQSCIDILIGQGVGGTESYGKTEDGSDGNLYDRLYVPYYNKLKAIEAEIAVREKEINIVLGAFDKNGKLDTDGLQTNIEYIKNEIQSHLNFQDYLGKDLWLQFSTYRREDKYSNKNYISDGLDNAELFKRALEFYRVAENEIFKSSELQHSITATLNNLLAIPKFKPLVESFKVGNWIRVQIDDFIYKLRLVEYEISYGDFDEISVKFSDVAKIKSGYSDLESILSNASSMATSYDSIQRQANQGNEARNMIRQWLSEGLDASLVQIQNNTNEDIVIDNNGLIGRSYSDITEEYSPEQIRLTHNIIAFTDDNWQSVKQAIGKHKYKYYDKVDKTFKDNIGYGVSADFLIAGYVTGSQIIGGNIISSNYKSGESGTYFNLIDGDFEIAGGNIVYDTQDKALTLKNVTIEWDSSTTPDIKDISGLGEYLEELDEIADQLDGRIQTYSQVDDPSESWADTEKNEHIGDLWINPNDGTTKRWTGSSWAIVTDSILTELAQSKAQIFTTIPTPPYFVGDLWVQGSTGDILHCITAKTDGEPYSVNDWTISSKYTDDTSLNEFIKGEYADELQAINKQIDKKAETWYQSTDPSLEWETNELKNLHIGDLWYNTSDNKSYIYSLDYKWEESDVPKKVYDAIDGKAQIFTSTPIPPYYVGDLWVQGSSGDIMHCIISKTADESYSANDWVKSSKYTDDTVAKEALSAAKQGIADAAKGINLANVAQATADKARAEADYADANAKNYADDAEANAKNYTDSISASLSDTLTEAYQDYVGSEISKLDSYVAKYLGLGGTTIIGENYVISPIIEGGYLNITNVNNKSKVIIDPNNLTGNGYIFQVHNGSNVSVGIDSSGNALFNGDIYATSLTLGDNVKIPYGSISGTPTIPTKLSELENDLPVEEVDKVSIATSTDASTGITTTVTTVGDNTYTTYTSSDASYLLTNLGVGSESNTFFKVEKDGLLTAKNAMIWGTVYANAGEIGGCSISDGKLQISAANITDKLEANQINMTGAITWDYFSEDTQNAISNRYQSQFSVDGEGDPITNTDNWHSEMTDEDMYRCDSYDGGETWGLAYQFRGVDGENGDTPDITYNNIKSALNRASSAAVTFIDGDSIDTADIYANNIYGGNLYGGDGDSQFYAQVNEDGFTIWQETDVKARMYVTEDGGNVGIDLGRGTVQEGAGSWDGAGIFHIYKDADTAYVIYNTPTNEEVGFIFNDDATIDILGTLNGFTGEGGSGSTGGTTGSSFAFGTVLPDASLYSKGDVFFLVEG